MAPDTAAQRFCDECGYDLGLHGTDEPSDDGFDCEIARKKAELLYQFDAIFGVR